MPRLVGAGFEPTANLRKKRFYFFSGGRGSISWGWRQLITQMLQVGNIISYISPWMWPFFTLSGQIKTFHHPRFPSELRGFPLLNHHFSAFPKGRKVTAARTTLLHKRNWPPLYLFKIRGISTYRLATTKNFVDLPPMFFGHYHHQRIAPEIEHKRIRSRHCYRHRLSQFRCR